MVSDALLSGRTRWEVAHQYGMNASVEAIRSNPNFKREVCRLIGQDIRVKENCDEANPSENDLPCARGGDHRKTELRRTIRQAKRDLA